MALLYHVETRDSSGLRLLVKVGCCRTRLVYEYWGYDSDYLDSFHKPPVEWLDDNHLILRYVEDAADLPKRQICQRQVQGTELMCEVQTYPKFPYQPRR